MTLSLAYMQMEALRHDLTEANARHEADTAALSQRLGALQKKITFIDRRNDKLSDQLGFLNEVAIRHALAQLKQYTPVPSDTMLAHFIPTLIAMLTENSPLLTYFLL